MKKIALFATCLSTFIVCGGEIGTDSVDHEVDKRARLVHAIEEAGGFLEKPASGNPIVIIDFRQTPDATPERVVNVLDSMLKLPAKTEMCKLSEGECPFKMACNIQKSKKASIVVAVIEAENKPSLSIFPEERIAVVNAAQTVYGADSTDAEARLIKEVWRGIGFVSGVGYSQSDKCVMQPVFSPLELDTIEWQVINPFSAPRMEKFLKRSKIKRGHRTTYKQAVEEGWAPPPTNDYQKAVWEEVKAAATNAPASK